MLRWIMPLLVAVFAVGTAAAGEPVTTKPADAPVAAKPAEAPVVAKPAEAPVAAKRRDGSVATKQATARAIRNLPPGLPHARYNARTTVAPPQYVRRGRQLVVVEEEDPDVLFTPTGVVPYAPRLFGTPVLLGSSTLPGYYGTGHSYSYDGA
jgi:hypothetical protein